jgi:hypothetical protein
MERLNVIMFFLLRMKRCLKSAGHGSTLTILAVFGLPGWVNDL